MVAATAPGRRAVRRRARVTPVVMGVLLLVVLGLLLLTLTAARPPAEPELLAVIDPASGDVSAFPAPGTPVANPGSQISLRGVAAEELGELRVVGSESGAAEGTLVPHADGEGVSFVPDREFVPREEVTVTTEHDVRGAQGASYSFTVAVLGSRPEPAHPPVRPAATEEPVHRFVSAPDLHPPQVQVMAGSPRARTELMSIGVKNGFVQKGPLLLDRSGEPVWFLPLQGVDARDVKVQTYRGEPVITWWEGRQATGYGWGEAVIVDQSYEEVARVPMRGGYDVDSHEVLLTEADTLLVIGYEPVMMDTSGVGGTRDGQVVDNIVQEIDIETGAVLFEWHSVGTVGLAESYEDAAAGPRFDYTHANAIDVDDDGNLLVSARHTCTVYKLDRATGSVLWRLGGRESDFAMGRDATFLKQHDARRSDDGTITLFDNGGTCGDTTRERSRGLALEVDTGAMTAEVAREFPHPDELFSESQANFQELAGGHVFLGWGSLPRWTEMGPDGEVLLDMAIPDELSITSYRAYSVDWVGQPDTDIDAVLQTDLRSGPVLHASWNGATEVARWRVTAQVADGAATEVGAALRDGFETAIDLDLAGAEPADLTGLVVQALDAQGEVLRSSPVNLLTRPTPRLAVPDAVMPEPAGAG